MVSFQITIPAAPRFEGDFEIVAAPGHQPTQAELDYIAAVNAALTQFERDNAEDNIATYPASLATGRRDARKAIAAELAAHARSCGSGNTTCDQGHVATLLGNYRNGLPKFTLNERAQRRFDGDFEIVFANGYVPSGDEQVLIDHLLRACEEFAVDKQNDVAGQFSPGVILLRESQRKHAVESLQQLVAGYWGGARPARALTDEVLLRRGQYQASRDRLRRRLFNVKLQLDTREVEDADGEDVLSINLLGGLPPPEDMPSPEKQQLYLDINKTLTVIRKVCDRIGESAEAGWVKGANRGELRRARGLQREFLVKLEGIARIGLELPYTVMARQALTEVRGEFFALEAGRIKNMYVRRLGIWAAIAAVACLAGYWAIGESTQSAANWWQAAWYQTHKNFLLAVAGAAIGTWASFSVRQVQFTFDDLLMLEEDSLDPPLRIIFVVTLTLTACLLFWTGAINLEIGALKTRADVFMISGSVALLVGLFAGLSERALATAISGRATAFVKGIAGAA
jgi:hypothetical protein